MIDNPPGEPSPYQKFAPVNVGRVLGVIAFLTLPVALFMSKAGAPLFVLAAALSLVLTPNRRRLLSFPFPLAWALFALVMIGGLSAIWSIEPGSSARSTIITGLTFFGGLVLINAVKYLDKAQRDFVEKALIRGGILAFAIILFEQASNWMLTRALLEMKGAQVFPQLSLAPVFNPGMSLFALYIWPMGLIANKRYGPWTMAAVLALALVVMSLSEAETPFLALMVGIIVATVAFFARRAMFIGFAMLVTVGVATAPLLPGALPDPETKTSSYPHFSHSALHRLSIWRTVGERISEKPVLGFGMNATRHLYSQADQTKRTYSTDDPNTKSWHNNFEPIPLHAHNGVLQIWLELGVLGGVALLAFLLAALHLIYRKLERCIGAACLGMMTSGLLIYSLSYSPWQSWWHCGLWLLAGFTVAIIDSGEAANREPSIAR
jgi:exopolysaccharide production protein ExoQ